VITLSKSMRLEPRNLDPALASVIITRHWIAGGRVEESTKVLHTID
jgi:hypothetical protein